MKKNSPLLSYITTCKGRLAHLKQTLPLVACQPDIECVVVDYGCPEGTADWVEKEYPKVKVVRVEGVQGFNASHARNIGARNATGQWLAFFDADILLDTQLFAKVMPKLTPGNFYRAHPVTYQTWGSIICNRADFEKAGGYDEVYSGWGGEDDDLITMLRINGVKPYGFSSALLSEITHDDVKRTEFCQIKDRWMQHRINNVYLKVKLDLLRMYGRPMNPQEAKALFSEIHRRVHDAETAGKKTYHIDIRLPPSIIGSPPQEGQVELYDLHRTMRYSLSFKQQMANPGIPKNDIPCI